MADMQPGSVLSHYRLVEKLGEGGMGVVWKALDTRLDRHVALKLLPQELTSDPERRRRFLREARAAAAVTHPNIVTVHEVDEAEGTTFLCMELVEGRTLRAVLEGNPPSIAGAVGVAAEMAEGLARAHRDGIVHRDLKPENVILGADGHPKILDFGLAKLVESRREALLPGQSGEATVTLELTGAGAVLGTTAYMSPEQARGEPVDARSDIFSFGVMLYEMVAGRRPFHGTNRIETLAAILHEPTVPASRFNAEVPARLEEILGKCLEKDAGSRYQTTEDLAVDLRRLRRDLESGIAPSSSNLEHKTQPRIRPWYAAALVGAAAIALGIALFTPARDGKEAQQAHGRGEIAVLPFENLSAEPSQAYFAGGLHDELLTQLSKVGALKVISRTSVMGYAGAAKPLKQIADELGVGSIVEGSVQVVGERLRVNVQLIDAATDRHLWAESYDRKLDDAFAIQSEVAQRIVAAVGVVLTQAEQTGLAASSTVPAQAYQLYLKGGFYAAKQAEEETLKAIRCYEQAVELAPDFAAAYAALARAHDSLSIYGNRPRSASLAKAREYTARALEIDPASAEAQILRARQEAADWDWENAETHFAAGLEAGGVSDEGITRDGYAFLLLYRGRLGEAVAQSKRSVELDPLSVSRRQNLGEVLYYARRYDESIAASREAIDMDPTHPQSHLFLGMACAAQGRMEEAVQALERDAEISGGRRPEVDSWLGVGYALAGEVERSRAIYSDMVNRPAGQFTSAFPLACICFLLGEADQGFEWLARGYEQRDHRMSYLKVHPACDPVREDPRYLEWLKKMGLDS